MARRASPAVAAALVFLFAVTSHGQEMASAAGAPTTASPHPEAAIAAAVAVPAKSPAQVKVPRFEIGTQASILRAAIGTATCAGCPAAQFAFGPAVTMNLNRNFALDAAASFLSNSSLPGAFSGGHLGQALVGIKAGIHGSRWTLFGKARPGVVTWSQALQQSDSGPMLAGQTTRVPVGRSTYFAFDLGGGVEYRLAPKVALRGDLGEMFIRLTPHTGTAAPATFVHNLQASTGVYYRFGKTIATEVAASSQPHRFFDRTNVLMMTLGMLAQSADAITTQRAFGDCRRYYATINRPISSCAQIESDPIARPFVSHGWGGQIGLGAMVNSAQALMMYGIHRMGHHRIERLVPVPLAIASTYLGYSNLQK